MPMAYFPEYEQAQPPIAEPSIQSACTEPQAVDAPAFRRKRVIAYIILSYGISWAIWLPNVISHNFSVTWGPSNWLHILGGLGPLFGGLLTTLIFDGRRGLGSFVSARFFRSASAKWLFIGFGGPVVLFLLAFVGSSAVTGGWASIAVIGLNSKVPTANPLLIWGLWLLFYGLGEEGGWRAFLFPEFHKKYDARVATLYTAGVWALWHLPMFFYDKDFIARGAFGTLGWVVGLVFGSLLLGWLVQQSRGNIWPAVLWHATLNFFMASDQLSPIIPAVMTVGIILLAMWTGRHYGKNLLPPGDHQG